MRPRRARGRGRALRTLREALDPKTRPMNRFRESRPTRWKWSHRLRGLYAARFAYAVRVSRSYLNGII